VLFQVALGAEGDEIPQRVTSLLAPLDLGVDLEIFERTALLTSPPVSLQPPLRQPPVNLLSPIVNSRNDCRQDLHFLRGLGLLHTVTAGMV